MSTPIPFDNRRAPVYGRYGMACSSTPLAAVIGRDVLQAGGNAADAALAMAAVVNVTEPMMSGLGGDMFAIVWKDGKAHGLNASGFSGSLGKGFVGSQGTPPCSELLIVPHPTLLRFTLRLTRCRHF